jgi:hypothetical protein
MKLSPRENTHQDFPWPVKALALSNETVACLEIQVEAEGETLTVKVMSITLGGIEGPPISAAPKKFVLQ